MYFGVHYLRSVTHIRDTGKLRNTTGSQGEFTEDGIREDAHNIFKKILSLTDQEPDLISHTQKSFGNIAESSSLY